MTLKFPAVTLTVLFAAGGLLALSAGDVSAQSSPRQTAQSSSPNYSYQAGPRTRVYISRRNWLDAGTEVLPGERKYTDYAFPPIQSFARENLNRPIDRQPLSTPFDVGGQPTGFPLY
ncbi:MAG TPA: hypothetical protein VNZ94_14925 [Xanthobacteraceae bacterium]|nr:hypothetical protein [Xanthobacteraceae bacterium]HWW49124.1 hypothetical protein [Xanthobacteraceae bacterium]